MLTCFLSVLLLDYELSESPVVVILLAKKWSSLTQCLEEISSFNKYVLTAFHVQTLELWINKHNKQCTALASGKCCGEKQNWKLERAGWMSARLENKLEWARGPPGRGHLSRDLKDVRASPGNIQEGDSG